MAKKISYNELKAIAEEYFVNFGYKGKDVAAKVDVTEATISKWRTEGKWDEKRQRFLASPTKVRELLFSQLEKVAEGEDSTIDADSLIKIFKVIEGLGSRTAIPVVMSVFKEFDNWMAEQDPTKAVEFLEYHKNFIIHKASLDE